MLLCNSELKKRFILILVYNIAIETKDLHMKKAFTMLELIFVIVVIGILAAVILPRTKTNPVQEAAVDLLSKIRYTQHLALVDDKYDASNTSWYKNRWQIQFNGNTYTVTSSDSGIAKDPSNRNANLSADLYDKYGVTVDTTQCNNNISFDYLGRPILGDPTAATGPYLGVQLVQNDCNITLSANGESATITITPETGYTKITF